MSTTDDEVVAFAKEYQELVRSVSLARCYHITDAAVVGLTEQCTNLRVLDLAIGGSGTVAGGEAKLTDASLYALAKNSPLLIDLSVIGCCLGTLFWIRNVFWDRTVLEIQRNLKRK